MERIKIGAEEIQASKDRRISEATNTLNGKITKYLVEKGVKIISADENHILNELLPGLLAQEDFNLTNMENNIQALDNAMIDSFAAGIEIDKENIDAIVEVIYKSVKGRATIKVEK